MGIAGGGAQAQRLVAHRRMLVRIPPVLSFEEAAAIPEAFITAHDALNTQGGFGAGQAVVIHAVGSGVGTAALQLVRAGGGLAIGTSRSREKLTRAQLASNTTGSRGRSRAQVRGAGHDLDPGPRRRPGARPGRLPLPRREPRGARDHGAAGPDRHPGRRRGEPRSRGRHAQAAAVVRHHAARAPARGRRSPRPRPSPPR